MGYMHGQAVVTTTAILASGCRGDGTCELEGRILIVRVRLNAVDRGLTSRLEIGATVGRTRQGRVASHRDVDSTNAAGDPTGSANSLVVLLVNVDIGVRTVLGD